MFEPQQLIVVRRGETRLFGVLQERFASGASPARVIWDRRMRDRRVIIRDDVSTERRRIERRAPVPSTWVTHGFLMARPDSQVRPRTRTPLTPRRAQALIESATRLGGVSACGHLTPRGLRTDGDHVRLYAQLLRKSGRLLPGEWRLRSLDRGSLP